MGNKHRSWTRQRAPRGGGRGGSGNRAARREDRRVRSNSRRAWDIRPADTQLDPSLAVDWGDQSPETAEW